MKISFTTSVLAGALALTWSVAQAQTGTPGGSGAPGGAGSSEAPGSMTPLPGTRTPGPTTPGTTTTPAPGTTTTPAPGTTTTPDMSMPERTVPDSTGTTGTGGTSGRRTPGSAGSMGTGGARGRLMDSPGGGATTGTSKTETTTTTTTTETEPAEDAEEETATTETTTTETTTTVEVDPAVPSPTTPVDPAVPVYTPPAVAAPVPSYDRNRLTPLNRAVDPVATPFHHRDAERASRTGLRKVGGALLLGGGFQDFTNSNMQSMTGGGGTWNLRAVLGTYQIVGVEAAYVGTAHNINALGLQPNAALVSNGVEGAFRLNVPLIQGRSLVEPFGFVGLGWSRYSVVNTNTTSSAVSDRDDVMTLPYGAGLAFAYGSIMADARFTYRYTYQNDLMRVTGGRLNNWGVGGQIGVSF